MVLPGFPSGGGEAASSWRAADGRGDAWAHGVDGRAAVVPARRGRVWVPRSLTNRLVIGVVGLAVVMVMGVGSATFFELRHFLFKRLDQQLASDAETAQATFYFSPRFDFRGTRPAGEGAVYAVAFDASGNTVDPNPGLASTMSLSAPDRARLGQRAGAGPTFVTTTTGERLRARVVQVGAIESASGSRPATVVVGLSTDAVSNTLDRLLTLELLIGAVAVLLALGATTYGVRRSLRRLQRVTRVAWEVSADVTPHGGGLSRRVPTSDMDAATEVGQLAISVNTLLTAVETQVAERTRSEQRMREFLLDASHELRTPLTSIRGYAELARMHRQASNGASANDEPAQVGDALDRIEFEGVRMSRLVDDLLALARSDEGAALHLRIVEVDELIHDAVDSARAAFPGRQLNIEAPPGLVIEGDYDQLLRVLRNLITNAAIHTRPDGPIKVNALRAAEGIIVQVTDNGPGLPPEDANRVFDRFWRADKSRTRARGGNGLGMSIVASTVHNHGGSVHFDSSVETGSTATVVLPHPPTVD